MLCSEVLRRWPVDISNLTPGTHKITAVYSGDEISPLLRPPLSSSVNTAPAARFPTTVSIENQIVNATSPIQL